MEWRLERGAELPGPEATPPARFPFARHEWLAAAVDATDPNALHVATVHDGGACRALALLSREPGSVSRADRFRLAGEAITGEPTTVASDGFDAAHRLAQALSGHGVALELNRLVEGTPLLAAVERYRPRHGVVLRRPASPMPYLELAEGLAGIEQRIGSQRRYDLRRARRRASASGQVLTDFVRPEPAVVVDALQPLWALENRGWKGAHGSSVLQRPALQRFIESLAVRLARRREFVIGTLHIDRHLTAFQVGLLSDDAYWLLKIGYDEQAGHCSPGQILLADALDWAQGEGCERVELLGGMEGWIKAWRPEVRPTWSLAWYPPSLHGGSTLAADALARAGWRR